MKILFVLCLIVLISFCACKKESFITSPDAKVTITADTLKYDTVFTSTGSTSQLFKIVNENDQKLRISSVKLFGGNSSPYKINVDGYTGPEVNNLEINANDSLYIFVSVTIDPSIGNLPFVVQDSIQIQYNGTNKQVQLEAWGQNAHFLRNKAISANEIWNNDLPYVILGYLNVEPGASLTINKGCQIYMHADAPWVIDGTLIINGDKDSADRVCFRGDRLDDPYNGFPAAWPGIFLRATSQDNIFNYAIIKNAYQAIALEDPSVNANPRLTLNECIIDNAYDAGIVAVNSSVTATNCLISNCGKNLLLLKGGDYNFTHCTVVSYSNNFILHKEPVLLLTNYITVNNTPVAENLNASFTNCIFWGENGTVDDEVVTAKNSIASFNVSFDHNLWKVMNTPANSVLTNIINDQSPQFDSINTSKNYYDFRLQSISPALENGVSTAVTIDLDGKPRPVGIADLGCFEKQ